MKHKMIGCSEECLKFACCDFCKYVIHDYFFAEDKNKNTRIVNGGPMGCALYKDIDHKIIAESCGYCPDFHCSSANEDNMVVKEIDDDEMV